MKHIFPKKMLQQEKNNLNIMVPQLVIYEKGLITVSKKFRKGGVLNVVDKFSSLRIELHSKIYTTLA